jgi:REP element-mobilizing transposase RayT
MPRTARIQFEGARYHVINRGNYRKDLFRVHQTDEAFTQALFEACQQYGWVLHAYVLMHNHYHLCLETPQANLSEGMHWLQSTFANRFSRFIGERGHVFHGRYKSLIVEGEFSLLNVVDYIHLNPVRAKVVSIEELKSYKNSSFPKYFSKFRPDCLRCEDFLAEAGGFNPTPSGMKSYHKQLRLIMAENPKEREDRFKDLSRGWFIGGKQAKAKINEKVLAGSAKANAEAKARFSLELSEKILNDCLEQLGRNQKDIQKDKKSAPWKLAIAYILKTKTPMKNLQISQHLNMGHPATMGKHISHYQAHRLKQCPYAIMLTY